MKRLLALSLSLLLAAALTMSVPIAGFAAEEPQCPLLVNITTDRSSYSTLGIAEFTVTVTNGSQAAVDGISAELLAGQLAPLGSKSVIKAESECLLPGESIGFMFKATLNKETVALNAFQRFGLGFIRLWYKNMPVADNGFDNGRTHSDTSKTIKFGNFTVSAVVRVWYHGTVVPGNTAEIVAYYNRHANAMKTYPLRVTVSKSDGTTSKLNYISGGSAMRDLAENMLPNDYSEKPALTFVNGVSGGRTLASYLPRGDSNLMSELDPLGANGVKLATISVSGGSRTVTIIMNDDAASGPTALTDKPVYISQCMDTLNITPEDLAPFTVESATAAYSGCKIVAVFDILGRMTKLDVTTPVRTVCDLKYGVIQLNNTDVTGTYNGNYTFVY